MGETVKLCIVCSVRPVCSSHKSYCTECKRSINQKWIEENRERYNAAKYRFRDKVKREAFEVYGNGVACCAQCGFDDLRALVLDHVNDDGAEHRRQLMLGQRRGGMNVYEKLRSSGWPREPKLQVLCANCNTIKEAERKQAARKKNAYFNNTI